MYLSIIIPSYNEEKRLRKTIEKTSEFLYKRYPRHEIIIVDDGSKDNTRKVAHTLLKRYRHITVLSHDKNHGKGYAVQQGMLRGLGDVLFFMDADSSTSIEEIEKCIPYLEKGFDIVIGSRNMRGSDIEIKQPLYRRLLGRYANYLIRLILLPGIKDSQCGFKGFTKKAAKTLFSLQRAEGWGFDFEILALARKLHFRVKEVPVRWLDSHGSRVRPIRGALRTLGELIKVKYRIIFKKYTLAS